MENKKTIYFFAGFLLAMTERVMVLIFSGAGEDKQTIAGNVFEGIYNGMQCNWVLYRNVWFRHKQSMPVERGWLYWG